jgi:hypothetical protein
LSKWTICTQQITTVQTWNKTKFKNYTLDNTITYVAVNLQITFLGKHFSGEIKFGWELDWRRRW